MEPHVIGAKDNMQHASAWRWELRDRYEQFQRLQFFDYITGIGGMSFVPGWVRGVMGSPEGGGYALFDRERRRQRPRNLHLVDDRLSQAVLHQMSRTMQSLEPFSHERDASLRSESVFEDLVNFLLQLVGPFVDVVLSRDEALENSLQGELALEIRKNISLEVITHELRKMAGTPSLLSPDAVESRSLDVIYHMMSPYERRGASLDDNILHHTKQTLWYLFLYFLTDFSSEDFERLHHSHPLVNDGKDKEEFATPIAELTHLLLLVKRARAKRRDVLYIMTEFAKRRGMKASRR